MLQWNLEQKGLDGSRNQISDIYPQSDFELLVPDFQVECEVSRWRNSHLMERFLL